MKRTSLLISLMILSTFVAALADDLTGVNKALCAPARVTICTEYGDCNSTLPWEVNVPQFIEIDLKKKRLATTEASGENRQTPIARVEREDGFIYLQGIEDGRAFSFVINEATGLASIAVARQDFTVTGFGACTPIK